MTELGIVKDVKPLQYPKAIISIEVTEFGMSMVVRLSQPQKALLPMVVMELGITIEESELHPENTAS